MSTQSDHEHYTYLGHSEEVAAALCIADSITDVARALRLLGNADAATPMGGMEAIGAVLKEGMEQHAAGLDGLIAAVSMLDIPRE